jgi:hypothetical protein
MRIGKYGGAFATLIHLRFGVMTSKTTHSKICSGLLLVTCVAAGIACAQSPGNGRSPENFAPALVEAIRTGGGEMRLAVIHSESKRCITPATQPYFDWIFRGQARTAGPGRLAVSAQLLDAVATALSTDGRSDYPVKPSHRLQIDFSEGPYKGSTLITYVA